MTEAAMTPEEWAKLSTSDAYIDKEGRIWCRSDCGGEPYAEDYEPDRLALAALCLHGRITWDMVDALRESIADHAGTRDHEGRGRGMYAGHPELAKLHAEFHQKIIVQEEALADLLESLMPTRKP